MPSLLSRLGQAARILTGREERGIPPPSAVFTSQYGIPALFNPGEYSGPRKLDHRLSYSGGSAKGV
jgi:hypothetical protein